MINKTNTAHIMLSLERVRSERDGAIVCIGAHRPIIQSMLDFDFLCGFARPRISAIIGSGRRSERFFWGAKECAIPVIPEAALLDSPDSIRFFANFSSGRRALDSTLDVLKTCSECRAGTVFAENVPELHALELGRVAHERGIILCGPASVGILIPGGVKLGAIGGVDPLQILSSRLWASGKTAVVSSSGGMTNELIATLASCDAGLSCALALGGDRFPVLSPRDAFLLLEDDPQTELIVYFGELGGTDEYEIADLLSEKRVTKPVIGTIVGSLEAVLPEPMQFGHAKALSQNPSETAEAKRTALRSAGMIIPESYTGFLRELKERAPRTVLSAPPQTIDFSARTPALFSSRLSGDTDGTPTFLGEQLITAARRMSYPELITSALLGRHPKSRELVLFIECALKLLADHGPAVSGAVNTMIAARAGKDLVSSLCAGLLTIGDRFGGAINASAEAWLSGVRTGERPHDFVERYARARTPIPGVGHKKYSLQLHDPRLSELRAVLPADGVFQYTHFARNVERITTEKKSSLILNVDGFIACSLLDLLLEREGMTADELADSARIGMFNAIFVLARSVGFIGHYLDQRRNDEGLFRLPERDIALF